jgi:hypothetical protein
VGGLALCSRADVSGYLYLGLKTIEQQSRRSVEYSSLIDKCIKLLLSPFSVGVERYS